MSRKRRRLRLPVSHWRTSLPRIRRDSRTPTPASTPSLSIDERTPRHTPTPVRRSCRLARPPEFQQDSDTSVFEDPSPTKSDTSRKDSDFELGGAKKSKSADQPSSPSKESDTSRKDLLDGPIRGVNVTKRNIRRHESDTSEVDKRTSPSKEESDTSRKDSTSDTRDENITKPSVPRQNIATELERSTTLTKLSEISRNKASSDTKDANNVSKTETLGSDSSEVVEKVTSYSNYQSDVSRNSNRTIENINVTRRGQNRHTDTSKFYKKPSPTLNEDSEESRSDSISDTTFRNTNVTIRAKMGYAEKYVQDVSQLKKRTFTSDDLQKKTASDTGVKDGNVTIRGQKYGERLDASELTKLNSTSSSHSPDGSVSEGSIKDPNVTISNRDKRKEDDELVKKLSTLFNEGIDASDTIARVLNVTTRAQNVTANENFTADESNTEKSLLFYKYINATTCAPKIAADKENTSANTSTSEDDDRPTSPERNLNKLDQNLGSLAPRRRRAHAGVVEYRRNVNIAKTTGTDDSFVSPDWSVLESDQSLGSLAPRRHQGVVKYRQKISSSANTTRLDHSLESSKDSDDYEQNIGILAPLRPRYLRYRRGVIEYKRNANATTINSSLISEIEVQRSEQTVVGEVSRRAGVVARANVDHELIEYEQALRPRRAGVQYKRSGDTPGVPVIPKPKRMRMDSDTDSQDDNGGGGMICVRADVHRPSSPQRSDGSLPMSLTPPASDPNQVLE
ncbi:protein starmaker-like isoform X2 [Cydia pomonella]|uniref:protein starmaker-like isoform X2 n=1 Tax=Cydia pomonella TaxID=82600 RepID=UPI002ADE36AF|nr:protein starmaker-like isoform X2 [Cydia pomonella]